MSGNTDVSKVFEGHCTGGEEKTGRGSQGTGDDRRRNEDFLKEFMHFNLWIYFFGGFFRDLNDNKFRKKFLMLWGYFCSFKKNMKFIHFFNIFLENF